MALSSHHRLGTITVSAGSTAVVGVGTEWIAAGIRPGDILSAKGLSISIQSITDATHLTLEDPWPGTALSGAIYEIRMTSDASRVLSVARTALLALESTGGSNPDIDLVAYYKAERDGTPIP